MFWFIDRIPELEAISYEQARRVIDVVRRQNRNSFKAVALSFAAFSPMWILLGLKVIYPNWNTNPDWITSNYAKSIIMNVVVTGVAMVLSLVLARLFLVNLLYRQAVQRIVADRDTLSSVLSGNEARQSN